MYNLTDEEKQEVENLAKEQNSTFEEMIVKLINEGLMSFRGLKVNEYTFTQIGISLILLAEYSEDAKAVLRVEIPIILKKMIEEVFNEKGER